MGTLQMNKTTIVASLVIGGMTPLAQADTLNVPNGYPTIVAAVAAALTGDTITVNPGVWVEQVTLNGLDISLIGLAGPDFTTIQATGVNDMVVSVQLGESLYLEGFTVTGGNRGLSLTNGSNAEVVNCRFQSATGVYISASSGSFSHCSMDDNGGDGVQAETLLAPLSFDFCSMSNNGQDGILGLSG